MKIAATLAGFKTLGTTFLLAKGDEAAVAGAVDASYGWGVLEVLVTTAGALGKTAKADALAYVEQGYRRSTLGAGRRICSALGDLLALLSMDIHRGSLH